MKPRIESADPGENPLRGGILFTRYGEGAYLYVILMVPAVARGCTGRVPHLREHAEPMNTETPDEPPPFLGTWPRVYAAIIVYLVALIALLRTLSPGPSIDENARLGGSRRLSRLRRRLWHVARPRQQHYADNICSPARPCRGTRWRCPSWRRRRARSPSSRPPGSRTSTACASCSSISDCRSR